MGRNMKWSKEEDEYIMSNAGVISEEAMMAHFPYRSRCAIRQRAYMLNTTASTKYIYKRIDFPKNLMTEVMKDSTGVCISDERFLECVEKELNAKVKELLYLRYRDKLSFSEIAKKYNVSRQWIFDIIRRAKKVLRGYICCTGTGLKTFEQYNETIYELPIPTRTRNALARRDIVTVDDLMNFSELDLLCINDIGARGIEHIKTALNDRGLYLKA